MSHIVIHDDNDNITQYRQFDDVQAAAAHLEQLHNVEGISGARLFSLDEVEFAVRSYVKVEIGSPDAAAPITEPAPDAVEYTEVGSDDAEATDGKADTVETTDTDQGDTEEDSNVEYVEASADLGEEVTSGEPRRGLFGR